jgi:hypothetical protein
VHKNEVDSQGSLIFATGIVQLVFTFLLSMGIGFIIFNHFDTEILTGETSSVLLKLLLTWLVGGIPTIVIILPIMSWITERYLEPIYQLNKDKFQLTTFEQSKTEHIVGIVSLILVLVLAFIYMSYPIPIVLSMGLIVSTPLAYVWLLHRNREKKLLKTKTQAVLFWVTDIFTILSFVSSFVICHFVINHPKAYASDLAIELKRAVILFQYSEAVVLGFILGWLNEILGKYLPFKNT